MIPQSIEVSGSKLLLKVKPSSAKTLKQKTFRSEISKRASKVLQHLKIRRR